MGTFSITTTLVTLGVDTDGTAVTRIRFHDDTGRPPAAPFDQRVARELREFLGGTRRSFSVPVRPNGTAFQRAVWDVLTRIPYGETRAYGDIARTVGRPTAARAVGMANHHNPIPIVIPCHRVVAADGSLGGFGGGVALKRALLHVEHAAVGSGQFDRLGTP